MHTVFVVEDEEEIRELVCYALGASGYHALGFPDGGALFDALACEAPSLILLDIMLPGDDGLSILGQLRSAKSTKDIPVILLTAKGSELDKVKGLDLGADDYITKPFGVMELVSRVGALLRRALPKETASAALSCGALQLDIDRHLVFSDGHEVELTRKEFDLLHFLLLNEGITLSRDKIMESVWGFDFEGESRTVDMHIKTLRRKLGAAGAYIHTVRGYGYKLEDRP